MEQAPLLFFSSFEAFTFIRFSKDIEIVNDFLYTICFLCKNEDITHHWKCNSKNVLNKIFNEKQNSLPSTRDIYWLTSSGLDNSWRSKHISSMKSSASNTCNHRPWAAKGCSSSAIEPLTLGETNVIAESFVALMNVKCRPCRNRPLKNQNQRTSETSFQDLWHTNTVQCLSWREHGINYGSKYTEKHLLSENQKVSKTYIL